MRYGSAGGGSATHIACVLLNAKMGTNIIHVPYRGAGPAMQDLMAGRIDFMCDIDLDRAAANSRRHRQGDRAPVDRPRGGAAGPADRARAGPCRRRRRRLERLLLPQGHARARSSPASTPRPPRRSTPPRSASASRSLGLFVPPAGASAAPSFLAKLVRERARQVGAADQGRRYQRGCSRSCAPSADRAMRPAFAERRRLRRSAGTMSAVSS